MTLNEMDSIPISMNQHAPYPKELHDLLDHLRYKEGWVFSLIQLDRGQGSVGLTLLIETETQDSYHPERIKHVHHLMIVPAAAYDRQSWQRWLFEQILLVERHETCEFFRLEYHGDFIKGDLTTSDIYVERPYAPNHGPGNDPYIIFEYSTDERKRTSFRGNVKDET